MTAALIVAVLFAVFGVGLIAVIERRERAERERRWTLVALRFGRDITPEGVQAALGIMAVLPRGSVVALDIRASARGVRHFVGVDRAVLETLAGQLAAVLPGSRLDEITEAEIGGRYLTGALVRLDRAQGVLRQDAAGAASDAVLASMQPLRQGERLLVRWLVAPAGRPPVDRDHDGRRPDAQRAWRAKAQGQQASAVGIVAIQARDIVRARQLLGRLSVAFGTRSTAHGRLRLRPRGGPRLARLLQRRSMWQADRLTTAELAGLIGWPVSGTPLPGVQVGISPVRLVSVEVPRTGRVLGVATHPASKQRPIAQPPLGALSHTLIAGPTGVGKSVLMTALALGDATAGRGLLLIDGKGDTAADLLARIPQSRRDEVVVLDCASRGRLPGLRVFADSEPELAADVILGIISDLFGDSWGPLSERYLRAGLMAVALDPEGTVADLPYVYSDDTYRRSLVARVTAPLVGGVFAAYEQMSAAERNNQLAAPMNKLGALLGRPAVRTVLGQPNGALDFNRVMDRGQIVVVSLASARIGAPAARLIAALIVHRFFQATLDRGRLPAFSRRPFMVYLDEPKVLADARIPLEVLLEQARGLGVGVTLSPQSVAQLTRELREAVLTNVATRVCFVQNADDARLLARDLSGISAQDLQDLGRFEALARIGLGPGETAAPVSLRTVPLGAAPGSAAALSRHAARLGQSCAEVDARLAKRHSKLTESTVVGRIRREES